MHASSVVQNSSNQVLEERWINSTPFMVINQINHQESGASNLQRLTSNLWPLLPTPALWFQLSWGDLVIMLLIMVMFKFTLHIFQLNLNPNQFQIQTPLQLNQLMIIKWIIFWNYSIQNMMSIIWMLTSRCFKLHWCLTLLQDFIQSLLWSFINTEEQILQSQIVCHTFVFFSLTKATLKLANENTGHTQVIWVILCRFTNCSIICPVGTVYYCLGHPSNIISSGALKFYVGF